MKDKTLVCFVVDNSGSMANIKDDLEQSIKTLIREQREISGKCLISHFPFAANVKKDFAMIDIEDIPNIKIRPLGSTALFDAACAAIDDTGKQLAETSEQDRPNKVIFVILTDGYENASKHFSRNDLKNRIEHQRSKYSWDFIFLGSNQCAITEAASLGIPREKSITFNSHSTKSCGTVLNSYLSATRSGDLYAFNEADRNLMNTKI